MFKKKGIILFILLMLITIIFALTHMKKNNSTITKEMAVSKINEEYFDISINTNEKTAIVDGNTVNLTELLAISNEELDEMMSNNKLSTFLNENLIGDIECNEESISIKNPYSTNSLIVETSDESIFENYDNIVSVDKIKNNVYVVDYENAIDTKKGYDDFKDNETIKNIMKDHKVHITSNVNTQNVSTSNQAWGVSSTGLGHYAIKNNYANNNSSITVAVLDTGINSSHEAFSITGTADKLSFNHAYDYVNDDSDVSDDNGHGTAVAGVVAESTSNNIKILPVKVMDANGDGYFSDMLQAISDINTDVDVINLSLGAPMSEFTESDLSVLENFFKGIYDSGTIVVCAAGNESTAVSYPAASAYTLAASAIDSNSNFASSFSNYGDEVDFALPGVYLKLPDYTGNTSYTGMSGTSFSCPFLAAAVADVKSDGYSGITDIVNVLKANAEDLGDSGKDQYYGYGSINFDKFMFEEPVIVKVETPDTTWAVDNRILIRAVSGSNMVSYAITTKNVTPSEWKNLDSASTSIELEVKTTNNGTNYIWIKDENNGITNKSIDITFVDNTKPTINSFEKTEITDSEIKLKLSVQDNESGISKIKWCYKKSSDTGYTEVEESCENNGNGDTSTIVKTHTFSGLESNTQYEVYAEIMDMVGNTIKTENMTIGTIKNQGTIAIENKTGGKAKVKLGDKESTENFSTTTKEEKITVTCDSACIVILANEADNSYTRLEGVATNTDNCYEFSYEIDDYQVIIALKGDVNLNGTVNLADAMLINRSNLSSSLPAYTELTPLQSVIADINKNGSINTADAMLISRAMLSETEKAYLKLTW